MRVTTFNAYENAIFNLQSRQRSMAQAQEQLTSGKRVAKPSDDPVGAARAERSLAAMTRADAHQRALEASRTATQLAESAFGDAGELVQQIRETLVAAGNASYSDGERDMLVQKMRGLREQLLSVANRADGTGAYIFGGQGSDRPPFDDAVGGVRFEGSAGSTMVASNESLSTQIDGELVWLRASNPHYDAAATPDPADPGLTEQALSVFDVVDRAITALDVTGLAGNDLKNAVQVNLRDLDSVNNHLLGMRARSGEALNRMETVELRIADNKLAAQTERSNAEDLDMVQAISDFQNQNTGYDAALKAYSLVQRMSLFNYING